MGAWIETCQWAADEKRTTVAPYMGAWIETPDFCPSTSKRFVAPYMGAWIETTINWLSS